MAKAANKSTTPAKKPAARRKKGSSATSRRLAALKRRHALHKLAGRTVRTTPSGSQHGNFGKKKSPAHRSAISKGMVRYWKTHKPKRNADGKCASRGCPLKSMKDSRFYKNLKKRMSARTKKAA